MDHPSVETLRSISIAAPSPDCQGERQTDRTGRQSWVGPHVGRPDRRHHRRPQTPRSTWARPRLPRPELPKSANGGPRAVVNLGYGPPDSPSMPAPALTRFHRRAGFTSTSRSCARPEQLLESQLPASDDRPVVRILGTHGVPARYGGFETAAENVARYLVDHGWRAIVYCQTEHDGPMRYDEWEGIERVNISVPDTSWLGTARFDLASIKHAVAHRDLCLTFGYNTAIFNVWQRLNRIPNVINMDGIEWSRARWGPTRQAILWTQRADRVLGRQRAHRRPSRAQHLPADARVGAQDHDDHLRRPPGRGPTGDGTR